MDAITWHVLTVCWIFQVLEKLSWKNLLQSFDKRRLQHEIDTHRLLLLTEHYARRARGVPPYLATSESCSHTVSNDKYSDAMRAINFEPLTAGMSMDEAQLASIGEEVQLLSFDVSNAESFSFT